MRIAQQPAVRVQEAEIDAPGVDADTIHIRPRSPGILREPTLYLIKESREIPIQVRAKRHGLVREMIDVLTGQLAGGELSYDRAPVGCSQVKCQKPFGCIHNITPNQSASPSTFNSKL
jgi:hypothetical protein